MSEDIKKIIISLDEASANYGKAKDTMADWVEELGAQKEQIDAEKLVWEDVEKDGCTPPSRVIASGTGLSRDVLQRSDNLVAQVEQSQIGKLIFTGSSATEAMTGATISGALFSYPHDQLPPSYYHLEEVASQRLHRGEISKKLRAIDESLADEYDNAWAGLYMTTKDKTRNPMFSMREVITRLFHHYAPDSEARRFNQLDHKAEIERTHRIKYIASKMDAGSRQTFLDQEKEFLKIYKHLCAAHKPGKLKVEKTKGVLYQADALIRLLLNLLEK